MVPEELPTFVLLRILILALPLEQVGAKEAILVTMGFGMHPLVEGHKQKDMVDSTDQRNIICSISETGDVADDSDGTAGIVRIAEGGSLGTMEERAVV